MVIGAVSQPSKHISALELFAGAGGLAMGAELAGVRHVGFIDASETACSTILENLGHFTGAQREHVYEADVTSFAFKAFHRKVKLLLAGAPCQPWSLAGRHEGPRDARNLFGQVIRALREVEPDALIIENVRGLSRPAFDGFREYLTLALGYPTEINPDEPWLDGLRRLRAASRGTRSIPMYDVFGPVVLNAADYGTPQLRQRVFMVALRATLEAAWEPPKPTHSRAALASSMWVSGEYWQNHGICRPTKRAVISRLTQGYLREAPSASGLPWRTVRDALADLPTPTESSEPISGHRLVRGARTYPGHSGSHWDWPSKTIKAGVHGVPGGENCLRSEWNGSVRYFTLREAARLQDFPDSYEFVEGWSQAFRQIGNAVPVRLATAVTKSVLASIVETGRVTQPLRSGR